MSCMQQYQIEMRSRIIQEAHRLLDHLPDDPKSTSLKVFPEYASKVIRDAEMHSIRLLVDPMDGATLLDRWEGFYTIFRDSCEQLHAGPEVLHRGMDLYADVREYIRSNIYF